MVKSPGKYACTLPRQRERAAGFISALVCVRQSAKLRLASLPYLAATLQMRRLRVLPSLSRLTQWPAHIRLASKVCCKKSDGSGGNSPPLPIIPVGRDCRGGKADEALGAYASALEVRSEYLPAMQGMARLLVREGRHDDRLMPLLDEVAIRSNDAAWRDWAGLERARLHQ